MRAYGIYFADTTSGDANIDNIIDIKDAVKLMKFLAGYDVELGVAS